MATAFSAKVATFENVAARIQSIGQPLAGIISQLPARESQFGQAGALTAASLNDTKF